MMNTHHTTFDPTHRLVETGLAGLVEVDDVTAWTVELERTLDALADDSTFAMIFDLRTYEPGTLDAHRAMRTVIPDALARHKMRPAYIDLFDPAPEMVIDSRPSAPVRRLRQRPPRHRTHGRLRTAGRHDNPAVLRRHRRRPSLDHDLPTAAAANHRTVTGGSARLRPCSRARHRTSRICCSDRPW